MYGLLESTVHTQQKTHQTISQKVTSLCNISKIFAVQSILHYIYWLYRQYLDQRPSFFFKQSMSREEKVDLKPSTTSILSSDVHLLE